MNHRHTRDGRLATMLALAGPAGAQGLPPLTVKDAEAALAQDPFMGEVKRLYPADFSKMVATVVRIGNSDAPRAALAEAGRQFSANLMARIRPFIYKAPSASVAAYVRAEAKTYWLAQRDGADICVALLESQPLEPGQVQRMSGPTREALQALEIATLRAAKAGEDRPVRHAEIREKEAAAVVDAFSRLGGDADALDRMFDGKPLPPEKHCATAATFFKAIAELPDDAVASFVKDTG